ncbi:MAG: precorrin-2 dehydrogenase [Methanofollis sp.]|nr:precorrin-2 dehydrogenase [Methanofollis sp.]
MIPLMIDLSDRHVVIFGGGAVGARKAAFFSGEARVTVISRSFLPAFSDPGVACLEAECSGMDEAALGGLIGDDAFLVVAATSDPRLNDRIGRAARSAGALFNNADGEAGDVLVPSVIRGERHLIALSTGGASPAVPRFLREHLQETFPHLDAMIGVEARLREDLKGCVGSQEERQRILRAVLHDSEAWTWLSSGEEQAYQKIWERYISGKYTPC